MDSDEAAAVDAIRCTSQRGDRCHIDNLTPDELRAGLRYVLGEIDRHKAARYGGGLGSSYRIDLDLYHAVGMDEDHG